MNTVKEMSDRGYPLMLVFYMDRELFGTEAMAYIADGINTALSAKEANAMAFFVPTDGEERIECVNPIMVEEADMVEINRMVQDIAKSFDIGQGADEGKDDPANEYDVEPREDETE